MWASLWDCLSVLVTWQLAFWRERSRTEVAVCYKILAQQSHNDVASTCLHRSALTNGEGMVLRAHMPGANVHTLPQFKWLLWEMRGVADYV